VFSLSCGPALLASASDRLLLCRGISVIAYAPRQQSGGGAQMRKPRLLTVLENTNGKKSDSTYARFFCFAVAASRSLVAHSSQQTSTVLPPIFTLMVELGSSG
jgi:hypothetical protein